MKKRSIKIVPPTEDAVLVNRIMRMTRRDIRSFAAATYLFGWRVSEALGLPKMEITGTYEYKRKTKKGIKTVQIQKIIFVRDEKGKVVFDVEPLKVWQIDMTSTQQTDHLGNVKGTTRILWARSVPTFKRPGRPYRDVPAIIDGPNELPLVQIVVDYVEQIRGEEGEGAPIWKFNRNTAFKWFRKELGINNFPHKIRDLRATKDSTTYNLDAKDLQQKYNWSKPDMAMYYGMKNQQDVIEKMTRRFAIQDPVPLNTGVPKPQEE